MPTDENEALARQLEATGHYRVLRKLEPKRRWQDPADAEVRRALVVDVETTGLDQDRDVIIQFSGIGFSYDPHSGRIFEVDEPLTGYEDPGRPIPAFVTRLTGITDADVAGQRLDEAAIGALAESAGLVIAHNASFDRPFLEARMPTVFGTKPWACSCEEIPWDSRGFPSRRLEYLLYQRHRLFFDAHSAEADCQALVHALAEPFENGEYPLALLLESARRKTHRIWAIKAPFDLKDQLKARGYRFNGGTDGRPKAWFRDVPEGEEADAEMGWLRDTVYGGHEGWQVEKFDARTRYGRRAGG
ncbi:MAG TPA: 3'-5' exonuclease [Gemmatimonadales bacterium]|nr:3'-5' exonuclease [Gemmatimonadales bacterium]